MKLSMLHEAGEGTRWTSKVTFDPSSSNVSRFGEGRCKMCGAEVSNLQTYCDQCVDKFSLTGAKTRPKDEFAPHPKAVSANPAARRLQKAMQQTLDELLNYSINIMEKLETKISETPTIEGLLGLEKKMEAVKDALTQALV